MGVQDLQAFLDSNCVPNGVVPVDLLKIARKVIQRHRNRSNKNQSHSSDIFRLVLDAECCLDRLYGGYFSDWVCGGQWNRMVQFLAVLIQATEMSGVELAIFFNGCNEASRHTEWIQNQLKLRTKVNNVLKHIMTKGTPPPKIWWSPPVCLRTSLRMALRHLKVSVMCTINNHHQEVIAYCREKNMSGLMADDAEYAVFEPPRYFSSEQLKLTYKGSLETKEYIVSEITKSLGIPADRLCILAVLLGNHILTEFDLSDFYKKLNIINTGPKKTDINQFIKLIANFVKDLPSINLDTIAQEVFGTDDDPRCSILRQSVQYYISGTKEGFLHTKSIESLTMAKLSLKDREQEAKQFPKIVLNSTKTDGTREENHNLGTSRFASETVESERESLNAYNEATASAKVAPQIVIESPVLQTNTDGENVKAEEEQSNGHAVNGTHNLMISSSSSSSSSLVTSPSRVTTDPAKENGKSANIPESTPEVMRTASERHQKGLMSPYIYQILLSGEIKLPVLLEDENNREFPSIHLIYRPVRQMVYAILFNLHHKIYLATKARERKDNERLDVPDVVIREWIWSKENPYEKPDCVKAERIGWGVPTIQRLWFGTGIDDKRRRLRGFLTCMKSDTPMMLNISYVPQHLLVMACVLRYIMSFSDKMKILRRPELDAFIAQAFSPDLMNAQYLQDLQLPLVTFRGVQLATLFMAGVETALFANDACGAPIPWLMCCPWLFFDGKLFHYTLARAAVAKNLLELCGGHIDRVVKVERMRKAILEGIDITFARPPIVPPSSVFRVPPTTSNIFPTASNSNPVLTHGRKIRNNIPLRELIRRPVPSRGGQLAIAGVIVGQWGANYGQPVRLPQSLHGPSRERLQSLTPFPRTNSRVSQPRGNNWSSLVTRRKKTQMKATSKKKVGVKRNQETGNKQHAKSCDSNVVGTPNANGFSKLLRKDTDTKEIIPSLEKKLDQTLDNKSAGTVLDDSTPSGSQSLKEN